MTTPENPETATGDGEPLSEAARQTLTVKIDQRLRDMPVRRDALLYEMRDFGKDFDRKRWAEAFESIDPKAVSQVSAILWNFTALQNYLAELTRLGLTLTGLRSPATGPDAPRDFRALRNAGAISADRCTRLIRLTEIRNELTHEYAEASPGDVHEGVELLLAELPGFISDYVGWLKKSGFELDTSDTPPRDPSPAPSP